MFIKTILSFIVFVLYSFFCFSQSPQDDIGARSTYFEKELQRKKKELQKPPKVPKIETPKEKEEPLASSITFFLKDIKITGSSIFSQQDFYPLYKDYLNRKISFKDLEEIINRINKKYHDAGYITTKSFIPQQELKDGVVEIKVEEGKIGDIEVEKNKYFSPNVLRKHIHLKKNEILNIKTLQKDLLRLSRNPDLDIQVILLAGKEPSTSDIILKAKEIFPWHIGISTDNRGLRSTGKIRNSFFIRASNFSGNLDRLFLYTIKSSGSFGQALIYQFPIDTYGTEFGINLNHFKMRLGKDYKHLKIIGESYLLDNHLKKELALSQTFQAHLNTGLKIKSSDKEIQKDTVTNEELRIPYFSFEISCLDPFGKTYLSPTFSFGTERFLGASSKAHPSASRDNTGGFFFKYEQDFTRVQKMPFRSFLVLNSLFQFTTSTLPTSEQIQLGGSESIRGYPEGDYLADIGGFLSLEWYFPFYLLPQNLKLKNNKDLSLQEVIQPVIFVDWGLGRLKDTQGLEKREKNLLGIGGGLRLRIINRAFFRVEWAKHLADEPTEGLGPSSFSFSFQLDF